MHGHGTASSKPALLLRKKKSLRHLVAFAAVAITCASGAAAAETILFVGNSFIYGAASPVKRYGAETVTDLNAAGFGGVPALFEAFTRQVGLDYEVSLDAVGGTGLDFHYTQQLPLLDRKWDHVVLSGYSVLDKDRPGDATTLIKHAALLADVFHRRNPAVQLRLIATWSRADQTYLKTGHWYGKPISAMAQDVRAANDLAATHSGLIKGVIPVGEAWTRAMEMGVADPNPYDGLTFGKIDLWAHDQYHASTYGYYLEALVIFGTVTGRDPLVLGEREIAADDLGISRAQAKALQQIARAELAAQAVSSNQVPTTSPGQREQQTQACDEQGQRARLRHGEAKSIHHAALIEAARNDERNIGLITTEGKRVHLKGAIRYQPALAEERRTFRSWTAEAANTMRAWRPSFLRPYCCTSQCTLVAY